MDALVVKDFHKSYGKHVGVDGISFTVKHGEVFGLIGPNGAGKTTTLRVLSTLLSVSSGDMLVYGRSVVDEPKEVRKIISYLPEDAGAYKHLSGRQYLEFISKFFTTGDDRERMVERGMAIADLGERIDSKVDTYSKGMTRRLLIARAIMTRPKFAILDEVTSGLDVINAAEIRNIIKDMAREGVTILLSSHNMFEVEYLCDRLALIDEGRIVAEGTPEELKRRYGAANIEEVFTRAVAS